MRILKAFAATVLLVTGALVTKAQNIEVDYLKLFATSFTDSTMWHQGSNVFWSLCLGEKEEVNSDTLHKRYAALVTDVSARTAFYKRFNYYLSGKIGHYTNLLEVYQRTEQAGNLRLFTYTQLREFAGIMNDYGQDSVLAAQWAAPVTADEEIFMIVEQMPEYPGGDAQLMRFLQKNIMYPSMERDNDIQGKVFIKFVVKGDGSVSNGSVARGVSPGLDAEAARVVKMLPNFKPGKQNGKPVAVWFNLPIVFRLQ